MRSEGDKLSRRALRTYAESEQLGELPESWFQEGRRQDEAKCPTQKVDVKMGWRLRGWHGQQTGCLK